MWEGEPRQWLHTQAGKRVCKKDLNVDECEFISTSIPVHPCSWQNMESLVLLEIAYPAWSEMKIISSENQQTVPGICKLPSGNVSLEEEHCPPEH